MEAATVPEVTSEVTLKVQEVRTADTVEPQNWPRQGAGNPLPKPVPPVEGDGGVERVRAGGNIGETPFLCLQLHGFLLCERTS